MYRVADLYVAHVFPEKKRVLNTACFLLARSKVKRPLKDSEGSAVTRAEVVWFEFQMSALVVSLEAVDVFFGLSGFRDFPLSFSFERRGEILLKDLV